MNTCPLARGYGIHRQRAPCAAKLSLRELTAWAARAGWDRRPPLISHSRATALRSRSPTFAKRPRLDRPAREYEVGFKGGDKFLFANEFNGRIRAKAGIASFRHSGARPISAFTRVFNALWARARNPDAHNERETGVGFTRLRACPGMTAME
jgi:hypothetical protein